MNNNFIKNSKMVIPIIILLFLISIAFGTLFLHKRYVKKIGESVEKSVLVDKNAQVNSDKNQDFSDNKDIKETEVVEDGNFDKSVCNYQPANNIAYEKLIENKKHIFLNEEDQGEGYSPILSGDSLTYLKKIDNAIHVYHNGEDYGATREIDSIIVDEDDIIFVSENNEVIYNGEIVGKIESKNGEWSDMLKLSKGNYAFANSNNRYSQISEVYLNGKKIDDGYNIALSGSNFAYIKDKPNGQHVIINDQDKGIGIKVYLSGENYVYITKDQEDDYVLVYNDKVISKVDKYSKGEPIIFSGKNIAFQNSNDQYIFNEIDIISEKFIQINNNSYAYLKDNRLIYNGRDLGLSKYNWFKIFDNNILYVAFTDYQTTDRYLYFNNKKIDKINYELKETDFGLSGKNFFYYKYIGDKNNEKHLIYNGKDLGIATNGVLPQFNINTLDARCFAKHQLIERMSEIDSGVVVNADFERDEEIEKLYKQNITSDGISLKFLEQSNKEELNKYKAIEKTQIFYGKYQKGLENFHEGFIEVLSTNNNINLDVCVDGLFTNTSYYLKSKYFFKNSKIEDQEIKYFTTNKGNIQLGCNKAIFQNYKIVNFSQNSKSENSYVFNWNFSNIFKGKFLIYELKDDTKEVVFQKNIDIDEDGRGINTVEVNDLDSQGSYEFEIIYFVGDEKIRYSGNVVYIKNNFQNMEENFEEEPEEFGSSSDEVILENDEKEIEATSSDLEIQNTEEKINIGLLDSDEDGLSNIDELIFGTNINKFDTDKDGLNDFEEIYTYFTDPNNLDTDWDGYKDGDEVKSGYNPRGEGEIVKEEIIQEEQCCLEGSDYFSSYEYILVPYMSYESINLTEKGNRVAIGVILYNLGIANDDYNINVETKCIINTIINQDASEISDYYKNCSSTSTDEWEIEYPGVISVDSGNRKVFQVIVTIPDDLEFVDSNYFIEQEIHVSAYSKNNNNLAEGEKFTLHVYNDLKQIIDDPRYYTDSDGDGISDTEEVELGLNKLSVDTDSDGINDGVELVLFNNPEDIDNDGIIDANDPDNINPLDSDGDGVADFQEDILGLDKNNKDTDEDGFNDGLETNNYRLQDPLKDYDHDGIIDSLEKASESKDACTCFASNL